MTFRVSNTGSSGFHSFLAAKDFFLRLKKEEGLLARGGWTSSGAGDYPQRFKFEIVQHIVVLSSSSTLDDFSDDKPHLEET